MVPRWFRDDDFLELLRLLIDLAFLILRMCLR
jgi:hypothetical protein